MTDVKSKREPSTEFMVSLRHAGTAIIECEHCGRILFAPSSDLDFDEEHMDELVQGAKDDPDKFVLINEDDVTWGYLDGKQTPWGCPCNSARPWEDWIWEHRHLIARYLRKRVASLKEALIREENNLVGLGVVDKT